MERQNNAVGVVTAAVRVDGCAGADVAFKWVAPSRELFRALAQYLLAGDASLAPVRLRASGLAVGSVENAVSYDYATAEVRS